MSPRTQHSARKLRLIGESDNVGFQAKAGSYVINRIFP